MTINGDHELKVTSLSGGEAGVDGVTLVTAELAQTGSDVTIEEIRLELHFRDKWILVSEVEFNARKEEEGAKSLPEKIVKTADHKEAEKKINSAPQENLIEDDDDKEEAISPAEISDQPALTDAKFGGDQSNSSQVAVGLVIGEKCAFQPLFS